MEGETVSKTIQRPRRADFAHETTLPECYDNWILPECYDHWDLPEVYIPTANNNDGNQRATASAEANSVKISTVSGGKPISPRRSCWRRHWAWWILVGVLAVGGAAGGSIAGVLVSRRQQNPSGSVVPASPTISETSPGATSLSRVTQPQGSTTSGTQPPARSTDASLTTASPSSGSLPSKPEQPPSTTTRIPEAISTLTPTPLPVQTPAPGTTVNEPLKSTSASPSNLEPDPLIGQPIKPTRAVQIGRARRPGDANDFLEIAFFPGSPCDYSLIGYHGKWVCDTPFFLENTEYQWKGCGSYTWLIWGPAEQRFGECVDRMTPETTCDGLLVRGVWLCRPE
ncbi:hypothetical protein QBC41DRAFT_318225 [Cercophora samala]|uniref:Uncharacterized protein n=1 Tax=Cercophora samala TaxID=330535 RepID=A0AA39ZFY1_9PEZI|nr:hypothetical protein QBC41DRAFT_318225 [Cercophora samala]